MNTSRPKRWLLWIVAVPAVGLVAVLLLGRPRFGAADLLDQLDPVLLRVERRFTREHTEPTSKAAPFLEVDLHSAVQALLAMAETSGLTPYSEIPRADWPAEVQRLNPVPVTYLDS